MKPRLVLVHGSLSSADQWDGYAAGLPRMEVVAIDLPGHGRRLGEEFTTESAVDAISQAVDSDAPTVLAGHSLGGYMATVFAARHPGRLSGLALLGATGDPTGRLAAIYKAYAWLVGKVPNERLAAIRDRVARMLGVPEDQLPDANAYATLVPSWRAVWEDCPPSLLERLDCPVQLINGQFDQMRANEGRYQRLTSGELVIVPRASHLAPMTHPEQVIAHLFRFVNRVCA